MRHGSLFSGIGGFDLAAEWMGWENIFHCEWNPFGQKILKHYWPNAISYTDITKTDFSIHRGEVDIITGGFPCQPFSTAGKRKGKEDNRYLWPEMLRAIREIQPAWIVAENVYGIINQGRGMVFEQVQAEMENEGYQVQSYLLPACGKNAPHKRDRFWFVAYSYSFGFNRTQSIENKPDKQWREECCLSASGTSENAANTESNFGNNENRVRSESQKIQGKRFNEFSSITNPERFGQSGSGWAKGSVSKTENGDRQASWAYANDRWPTQSPIRGGNDGLSSKLHQQSLEAYGNAIVPQVALEIFKAIELFEKEN